MNLEKHERAIRAKAWKLSRQCGVPFEDLDAEGRLIWWCAVRAYERNHASGASFKTFLNRSLEIGLRNYTKRWNHQHPPHDDAREHPLPEASYEERFDEVLFLQQCVNRLSPQAQGVVSILMNCANELMRSARSQNRPKHARGALQRYLCSRLGWSLDKVRRVFAEIKEGIELR